MSTYFTRNDFEKITVDALEKSRTLLELLLADYLSTTVLIFQAFKINNINTGETLKYYTAENMGIIINCLESR